jgi:hypothetical protein
MQRRVLPLLAGMTASLSFVATPSVVAADPPIAWVVVCVYPGGMSEPFESQNPSDLGDMVELCHVRDGQVSGVYVVRGRELRAEVAR